MSDEHAPTKCPVCGNTDDSIDYGMVQQDTNTCWQEAECGICSASWTEVYGFSGIENLKSD